MPPTPDQVKPWLAAATRALEHRHAGSLMAGAASFSALMILGEWVLSPLPWYVPASLAVAVAILVALVNEKTPDK